MGKLFLKNWSRRLRGVISPGVLAFIGVAALLSLAGGLLPANAEGMVPTGLSCDLLEHPEETVITTAAPRFGWVYNPSFAGDAQTRCRVIVASSETLAESEVGDMWDSGLVNSSESINVLYRGRPLAGNRDYYWRVQTADSRGQIGPFSRIQHFRTDTKLVRPSDAAWNDPPGEPFKGLFYNASSNYWANRYPSRFVPAAPVLVTNTGPGRWFVDFGQDAFGYATVRLNGSPGGAKIQARFGEMADGLSVRTDPPESSTVRYTNVDFVLQNGDSVYSIRPPVYSEYDPQKIVNPPKSLGTVMPFRYFELLNVPGALTAADLRQERLLSEFDTNAASFNSSSPALNQIWNLCRNSMQILTFDGIYVDGDRERTPYEADAYIHQMSAYAVDREFTMPRYTFEYLLQHPTWPTEWKFHIIFMAWADYQQTGNADLLYRYYDALKPNLLAWAATGDGLIRGFPSFPMKSDSDVVDWPPADRDGFVIKKGRYLNWTNSVNNAFYYRSLKLMARIAGVVGHSQDASEYDAMASRVYKSYNKAFWDRKSESYVDGVGTTHSSAHANFFPLAFGLVPPDRRAAVIRYLHSRIAADDGMPASVYGAQYMLDALFENGDADTALDLMTTNGPRGWLNMINMGSTLTTEAWSFEDKKNTDWNHAWGAAPANVISRYVLGVRPITAGFDKILIEPELGTTLSYVDGTVPTIRGPVTIQATSAPESFRLIVNIPGNVAATVLLPAPGPNPTAVVDGKVVRGTESNGLVKLENIGSGRHSISVSEKGKAFQAALAGGD
ncbi:MAG TPA: alpha-L-rhamnosidase C-terminal domain-containing protein [Candidatus Sulfotelmatobacter sp.]|nr:alpha-L-rhamnosidase C-terminal domain-containing protein [Candidatus Sulfotelmatobacter sp.]